MGSAHFQQPASNRQSGIQNWLRCSVLSHGFYLRLLGFWKEFGSIEFTEFRGLSLLRWKPHQKHTKKNTQKARNKRQVGQNHGMSHLLDVQFQASDGPRQRVQIRSWAMVATAWQHWPGVLRIVSFIVFHEPMAAYQKKIYSNVWWKYSNSSKLMVSFCCHVSSFKTFHMFSIYMWHAFDRLGHLINPVTIQLCFRPSPSCLDDLKSWTEIRIVFQKNSICSKLRISK